MDGKEILLFEDADADDGQPIELPGTLTLSRGEDDEETVRVRCEIVEDAFDEPLADDDSLSEPNSSDYNPLDV